MNAPTNREYNPDLQTERLLLRKVTLDDAEDMFAYAAHPEVARYTTWEAHQSVDDSRAFIQFLLSRYEAGQPSDWAIVEKDGGRLIGTCGFVFVNERQHRAEIGYAMGQAYWGRGYMTEIVRAVLKYGFENLALNRIEAKAVVANAGSWRVMEKCGMQFEGVLRQHLLAKGVYHDLKLYSILHEEWEQRNR